MLQGQDPVFSAGSEEMREGVKEGGNKVSEKATRRAEEIICPPGRECVRVLAGFFFFCDFLI